MTSLLVFLALASDQNLIQPRLGHQERPVLEDVPRVELGHRRQLRAVNVPRRLLDVRVPLRQREQARPVDPQRLVHLRHDLGLGRLKRQRVHHANVISLELHQQRALGRQLTRLLRHRLTPVLRVLLLGVTAALLDRVADAAGAGIAGPLLAEHLSGRIGDLAAGLGADRALAQVRVIHHDRLLQQVAANLAPELRFAELNRVDLAAGLVVNRYFDHGIHPTFLPAAYSSAETFAVMLLRTNNSDPLGPGSAPLISSRFLAASTPTSGWLRVVTWSMPMWPAMRTPFLGLPH